MRNKLLYMIGLGLLAGLFSCADDQGNYDYRKLNTITISGLASDSVFYVDQNSTLKIEGVKLDFALEPTDRLKYEWYVRGKLVGTEPDCNGKINEVPGNRYNAYLCVTDTDTDLKYYQDFLVTVSTVYANALWVLSETADGTAKLSVQRRDQPGAALVHDVFELNNPEFGKLGGKPVQITTAEMGGDVTNFVYLFCQEGERRISKLERISALLMQGWDAASADAPDLLPVNFSNEKGTGMMTTADGRLFNFNYSEQGLLYDNTAEGYRFSWAAISPDLSESKYWAYDEVSDAFYTLSPKGNPFLYNRIEKFDEAPETQGLSFLTYGTKNADKSGLEKRMCPVLYNPQTGMEHYYEFSSQLNFISWEPLLYEYKDVCKEKMQRPRTIGEQGLALLSNLDYWYAAAGNKLIRFHFSNNSEVVDWTEELEGEITALMFDFKKIASNIQPQSRIFVATYDGTKGYIHEFDLNEAKKELNAPLEVDGKVVSMCVAGTWKY